MEKFFEQIEKRAINYFTMSEDDKDELLADFANIYIKGKFKVGITFQHVLRDLEKDIERIEGQNRFELAALLNDVRISLSEVAEELDAQHKQQINKGK
jgi:hypothetical protein